MTGAAWYRFRAEARHRLAAWLMLSLVIGIGAGALLAAMAGARRTTDAYDRFVVAQDGLDAIVIPLDYCGPPDCDPHVLEDLDSVAESVRMVGATLVGGRTSRGGAASDSSIEFDDTTGGIVLFVGSADGRLGTDVNKWLVVDGRAPAPDAANEAILTQTLAQDIGVRVGDSVELEVNVATDPEGPEEIVTVELDIVGTELAPSELEPLSGGALKAIYATPALVEARPELFPTEVEGVRLRGGADARAAFVSDLENRNLQTFPVIDSVRQRDAARARFRDDAAALMVFAAIGGLAIVVLAGQALHRQQLLDSAEDDVLRALGCARTELRGLAFLRAAVVAVATVGVATVTAVALSPLAPVGEARSIEVDPGVNLDWFVLGGGALALVAGVLALMAATERIIRSPRRAPARVPSAALSTLSRLPGLHVRLGAGLAFERARRSVPTASVLASVTLAVGAVAAATTFGASLDHLQSSPALYGQPWDAVVSVENPQPLLETDAEREVFTGESDAYFLYRNDILPERAAQRLAAEPDVVALSRGSYQGIDIGPIKEQEETALALDPVKGALEPSIIEGRSPRAVDEIAVGDRLLDQLGLDVGDTVEITHYPAGEGVTSTAHIVGRGVFAIGGEWPSFDGLGGGVLESRHEGGNMFIRFANGADKPALLERFERELGLFPATEFEFQTQQLDVDGMEATPVLIAALTGLLGAATPLHFGVVSARRHSRHLAVLRALGMRRRDCVRVLVWHAMLVAGAALVIGVPLGIASGRLAWLAIADGLHVVPVATLPPPATALVAVVVLGAALIAAGVPGRFTTRHAPAMALRAE